MTAGAALWALCAQLGAGIVVDGAAAVELRAAGLQPEDQIDVFAPLEAVPALQTTPSVRAALESEGKAASASYGLSVSAIPAPASVALLHRGEGAFELALSRLVRTRGTLALQGGELDPLQAQLTLVDTGRLRSSEAALPYFAGALALAAELRLSREARLEAGLDGATTAIAANDAQALHAGELHLASALTVSRRDEVRALVAAHLAQRGAAGVAEHDAAPGLTARADWTHQLLRNTGVGVGAGMTTLALMSSGDVLATVVRPVGDVRAFGLWDLGAARALGADGHLGLEVTPNPVGGIAESRLVAALGLEARLAPGLAVGAAASGFSPQRVTGGAPLDLSPTGQAGVRGAWSFDEHLRLDAGLVVTGVAPPAGAMVESIVATIAVSGTTELWHSGGRPRGTGTMAGDNLGVQRIGAAPAAGSHLREPPPPPPVVDVPPPPPPELAPPPVQAPLIAPPPPPPVRLPKRKPKPKPGLLGNEPDEEEDLRDRRRGGTSDEATDKGDDEPTSEGSEEPK